MPRKWPVESTSDQIALYKANLKSLQSLIKRKRYAEQRRLVYTRFYEEMRLISGEDVQNHMKTHENGVIRHGVQQIERTIEDYQRKLKYVVLPDKETRNQYLKYDNPTIDRLLTIAAKIN